jgi:hypothetical protein
LVLVYNTGACGITAFVDAALRAFAAPHRNMPPAFTMLPRTTATATFPACHSTPLPLFRCLPRLSSMVLLRWTV